MGFKQGEEVCEVKDILFLFEMMILSEYVGLRILSLKIFSRFARFPISNLLQFKDYIPHTAKKFASCWDSNVLV